MDQTYRFQVNKLIRDKLPEIIEEEPDSHLEYFVLNDAEYLSSLKKKLIEEALEVSAATTLNETKDELADILEVFLTLLQEFSFSLEDIEQTRQKRREERGGFQERIYCKTVSVSDQNPQRLSYYRIHPDQYPEVK